MAEPVVIVLLGANLERLAVEPGEELRIEPDGVHRFTCVSSENGITVWTPAAPDAAVALTAGASLRRWTDGEPGDWFSFEPGGEPGGLDAAFPAEAPAPHH